MLDLVSSLGRSVYELAGLDPAEPLPRGGAVALAVRAHHRDVLYKQARPMADATVARVGGKVRIVVREGTPARRLNYLVAQMLARIAITGRASETAEELDELERRVAAWLVAPTVAFREALEHFGVNIARLADAFAITETCATMRIQEVGGPDAIVTTPTAVHRRGRLLSWAADEQIRELAANKSPRSVRRVVLHDEPRRVALLAKAG